MKEKLKIAYILHRFPYLTETFIMREMHSMGNNAVDVHIFSLLPPVHDIVHQEARDLLPKARYSSFISWQIIAAQLYFLVRHPVRYLRSLVKTVWQTCYEPKMLLRALAIFPKSVLISRQMQQLGIQHAHAHFVWLEGIAAGIAADLIEITFTIHPHAFGLFSRNQRDVRCELENATKVVTVSQYHRDYIAALCPRIASEDITVVHYGVNTEYFHPEPRQASDGPLRILSVGRVVEKKGYEYLVDACALLMQRGVNFRCDIVGGGGQRRNELRQRIENHGLQDRVSLVGPLGQDEILSLYQTVDIFALACTTARNGDQDGMPNVLLEAMACELPVVTTRVAGIPDLVVDGRNGRLVRQRDARALADALAELISRDHLRQTLGETARRTVIRDFRIDKTAAHLAGVFKSFNRRHREPSQAGDSASATEREELFAHGELSR